MSPNRRTRPTGRISELDAGLETALAIYDPEVSNNERAQGQEFDPQQQSPDDFPMPEGEEMDAEITGLNFRGDRIEQLGVSFRYEDSEFSHQTGGDSGEPKETARYIGENDRSVCIVILGFSLSQRQFGQVRPCNTRYAPTVHKGSTSSVSRVACNLSLSAELFHPRNDISIAYEE